MTELMYPGGDEVEYAYDESGRLTSVTDWAGRKFAYGWTLDGHVESLTYPNGVVTAYDHDDGGQILGITTTDSDDDPLLHLGYAYSAAGLVTSQDVTRSAGARAPPVTESLEQAVAWDAQGRLASITGALGGSFGYDGAGSPTTLPGGRTLGYDTARQLTTLSTAGDDGPVVTSFTYDARGNRATTTREADTRGHVCDLANRLTSLVEPDGTTTTYTYAANNLRATATTGNGPSTRTETFVWDTLAAVPLLLADGAHRYVYGAGTAPVTQVDLADDEVDYLHGDLIGSVRTVTDGAGVPVADSDYDAYGTEHAASGDPVSTVTRFGYAGEYTDPNGYVYLRNRYYDPATAQFLTVDALVHTTGDAYGYTGGNPLQLVDPLGLFPSDWGTLAAGIVNLLWGTAKIAQGGAVVFLGATATVTGVGAVPGVAGMAIGAYHIGSGVLKAAKGARQITSSMKSEPMSGSCVPIDWKGNSARFLWGTVPFGAFFDKNTDWLDEWGSLL